MPEEPNPKARPHPWKDARGQKHTATRSDPVPAHASIHSSCPAYAELQVTTNYTFLTGASHPEELVRQSAALGHRALAITDLHTLAGIVRAHVAAKETGIRLVVGARVTLGDEAANEEHGHAVSIQNGAGSASHSLSLLLYATDRPSYGRLCRLLTTGKRRSPKGECRLTVPDIEQHAAGMLAAVVPPATCGAAFTGALCHLRDVFDDDRISLAASCPYGADDAEHLAALAGLSSLAGVPLVAANDVHYHVPERRALQDVLTCVRHGCTIQNAGRRLFPNGERHLKSPEAIAHLFRDIPAALARTVEIAERAAGFTLDELRYEYPEEVVPPGSTAREHLTDLAWKGAAARYPGGVPEKVRAQILHELALIAELKYEPYFLTVHDIVVYARSRGILCQGRGAAANSAVCYCLGVTSVDPSRIDVLFERFVSRERNEPPDIDIDFEHERREEVIQYLYAKYGRERAALTAEVITYRGRSAVRDVGKAMGLSLDAVDRLAKQLDWWHAGEVSHDQIRDAGFNPSDPTLRAVISLTEELVGFPRHLSQHVGGFVITRGPLCETVPIENAAMPDRTVIEWDKDDIDALGILKVDVLGLGMLTCIGKCFRLIEATERRSDGATKWPEIPAYEQGGLHGDGAQLQGPDRMAEEHGARSDGLQGYISDAGGRAVRIDQPDASCSCIDPFEYRGGLRASESSRLHQAPANREGLADGIGYAVRVGRLAEHDQGRDLHPRNDQGGRPDSSGACSEPGTEGQEALTHAHAFTSSLRRSVAPSLALHTIPPEDPAVYDMICSADTIGVFQIESRAQMSMLPRLRPRCFYDLVIEVAIVRPGPIQGDMVHPYLRRRNKEEPVSYPDARVEAVLGKTLGVPLFQEQAMALAIVAAGFTPGEADQLRRAMAAWKRKGDLIFRFGKKIVEGMTARGYPLEFAERCFEQIKGFSEYGFPESHAASFALLVYVSAWLKHHHPAAFAASLINSQPMGFYAPAQIVRDAKEHGVEVRAVDVNRSAWDCTLESEGATERRSDGAEDAKTRDDATNVVKDTSHSVAPSLRRSAASSPSLRLGMRLVGGLRQDAAESIARAVREHGPFKTVDALWRSSGVGVASLRRLAAADAFGSMGLDRQGALWEIRRLRDERLPLFDDAATGAADEPAAALPPVPLARSIKHDYDAIGLSLKAHPLSLERPRLDELGVIPAIRLRDAVACPAGARIAVAGLVLVRQRPGTASGIVFMTIEDETAAANLILFPQVYERFRKAARHSVAVVAWGKVERQGEVIHVMVKRIANLREVTAFGTVGRKVSRDFH